MIVSLAGFTGALAKITAMTAEVKAVSGIMLNITADNTIDVCYSDGRKSIYEKVEITHEDDDITGQLVLPYSRITDIISICQPSGIISTRDLQFSFKDNNVILIKTQKVILEDAGNEEVTERVVSNFEQSIKWEAPESSAKYGMLNRTNYSEFFECVEDNTVEVDDWGVAELREILSRLSVEKGKIVYLSSKYGIAFVANLSYATSIPIRDIKNNLTLSTGVAKSVIDIIGRVGVSKLLVYTQEDRYCTIVTGDGSVGLRFEMVKPNRNDIVTLDGYKLKDFKSFQLSFIKEAILNVIRSAVGHAEKNEMAFSTDETTGETLINIKTSRTMSDATNVFSVVAARVVGDTAELEKVKLPVNIKALNEMITNCTEQFIAFDVDIDANGDKNLRIADIDFSAHQAEEEREKQLIGKHFMTLERGA